LGIVGAVCRWVVDTDMVEGLTTRLTIWNSTFIGGMDMLGAMCHCDISIDKCRERIQLDSFLELLGLWRAELFFGDVW
jgi:hypothetical protein